MISNDQVVSLYESLEGNISIEDLVEAFDGAYKPTAIKIALMNGSRTYRDKVKQNQEEFSEDDKEGAKQVLRNLMISADSDMVRLRAACRIYDEKKGRKDIQTAKTMNFSLTLINQQFQEADKAIAAAKAKVIEINPEHKHLKEIAT